MIEFGSDYHLCGEKHIGGNTLFDVFPNVRLYACGRHAFSALLGHHDWKRIWIPAYFCYEVIAHIEQLHITVKLYNDFPNNPNVKQTIESLPTQEGDVLLRVNYFGIDLSTQALDIDIPIIEDHTLGLNSEWAKNSTADWCVASLRKSLPVAIGGMLWSPKQHTLPQSVELTNEVVELADKRYEAMSLKAAYLNHQFHQKDVFRNLYIETEQQIETLQVSRLDNRSIEIIAHLNIETWMNIKTENWETAHHLLTPYAIRHIENAKSPFSILLKCASNEERELLRKHLIQRHIYPAILWTMPEDSPFDEAKVYADTMLSVHCDARYDSDNIVHICKQIIDFYG